MTAIPKPERRGPKPRSPIRRYKRPAYARVRGGRGKLRMLADDLQSLYIRHQAKWTCWVCGSRRWEEMQAAHLFAKSEYQGGRYQALNVVCLCFRCHKRYTHRPTEWTAVLQYRLGMDEYEKLRAYCKLGSGKHDYAAVAIFYAAEIAKLPYQDAIADRVEKLQKRGEELGVW